MREKREEKTHELIMLAGNEREGSGGSRGIKELVKGVKTI